jgi:hypothetical protein
MRYLVLASGCQLHKQRVYIYLSGKLFDKVEQLIKRIYLLYMKTISDWLGKRLFQFPSVVFEKSAYIEQESKKYKTRQKQTSVYQLPAFKANNHGIVHCLLVSLHV